MKSFKIFNDGKEGKITIDGLTMVPKFLTKLKVVELKIGSNIIVENKDMTVCYKIHGKWPLLKLDNNKLIELNNPDLIEYIWSLNKDTTLEIYKFTREFKGNWCD